LGGSKAKTTSHHNNQKSKGLMKKKKKQDRLRHRGIHHRHSDTLKTSRLNGGNQTAQPESKKSKAREFPTKEQPRKKKG